MQGHAPVVDEARETLARVITALRADPVALSTAADVARFVGRRGDALPQTEVRRQIEVVLDAVLASLSGGSALEAQLVAADDFAADRAKQGIPLTVILEGFNAARQFILQQILEVQAHLLPADELIRMLVPLDEHVSALHARMITRYREAERTLARSGRAARIDALRELLGGGPVTWAEQAELDLTRQYHCVLADVTNPRESTRIEALLKTPDGLSGIVRGYLCRVTPQYPAVRGLDVLAVASMPVPPHELADAYRLCRDALSAGRARGVVGLAPGDGPRDRRRRRRPAAARPHARARAAAGAEPGRRVPPAARRDRAGVPGARQPRGAHGRRPARPPEHGEVPGAPAGRAHAVRGVDRGRRRAGPRDALVVGAGRVAGGCRAGLRARPRLVTSARCR